MNVDDIMASNYINIDSRIEIAEMVDEEEKEVPNNPVALDSIQNTFDYFQQNSNIKVNRSVISG